jgi:hypothetical protein
VTVPEEKLAGLDQALAELGKSDEEISEVCNRFASAEPVDLQAVDGELSALSEEASIEVVQADWDDEHTEVEIIDESDFVLLVDEDELEELEKIGEDDALKTSPPPLPQEGEEDEGFFKKLFSNRRTSNRP